MGCMENYKDHEQLMEWLEGENIEKIRQSPITKSLGSHIGEIKIEGKLITCVFNCKSGRGGGVWSALC